MLTFKVSSPFKKIVSSAALIITSTEDYIQKLVIESTFDSPEHRLDPATNHFHYTLTQSLRNISSQTRRSYQLFHYLNGVKILGALDQRIFLDFNSSITASEDSVRINFTSNHPIRSIEFILILIFENPDLYKISVEEISFDQ